MIYKSGLDTLSNNTLFRYFYRHYILGLVIRIFILYSKNPTDPNILTYSTPT